MVTTESAECLFLNPLVAAGTPGLSRLRKDAVGGDDLAPVVGPRSRGRPRKQGPRRQLAQVLQLEPITELTGVISGKAARVQVVGCDVCRRNVTPKVRVVVIATNGDPILLVSTDGTLLPEVMIQLSAARFPLALSLRDLKQYSRLGD